MGRSVWKEMMSEEKAIATGNGKWAQPGVPHRGWQCVDWCDLREDDPDTELETCEMCESQEIRFVHNMRHREYPTDLRCGCVCARHMEQNYEGARRREKSMRSRAARRSHFPKRAGW